MTRLSVVLLAGILAPFAFAQDDVVRVTMSTAKGEIEIDLYASKAPVTVANFLQLVDGGHLDGGKFYRVVSSENDNGEPKIEVIQGGRGAAESPFPPIEHETTEQTGILHTDGVISMARAEVGTATSEFFICIGDQPGLDFGNTRHPDKQGFAAFGRVVRGMDVVREIHLSPADARSESAYTRGQILTEPVEIIRVARLN